MRRYYGWNTTSVMPDDLIAFAWSEPMRDLAAKVGMSDAGLKKQLASYGIALPPQGYWNKLKAGKPVLGKPKASPRRPGETGRFRMDERFAKVLAAAPALPSTGPFASRFVPEDLEELRAAEVKALGRVSAPKSLDGAHRGSRDLLAREARRREKFAKSDWQWDKPQFDTPVAQRRLRILNGIFLALAKRGHDGHVADRDGALEAGATIGDTYVSLDLNISGKPATVRAHGYLRPDPALPASTPLALVFKRYVPAGHASPPWCDDGDGKLEHKLAAIVADIIVAGEWAFRIGLAEAEKHAEEARLREIERRKEALAALNKERVANLLKSGELLRQAQDLRSLVAGVRLAMEAQGSVSAADLAAWEHWAMAQADLLDPIVSGQFMSHFALPRLP